MSTHKSIERICCAVLVIVLLVTLLFCNAERMGIKRADTMMGYETRLFDPSRVHTIEIMMDDWEGFLEECENEEYQPCSLVIDNEAYKNVALRAKGNTSLSMVRAYGNSRYSFKIEFDHYDSGKNYYGLDKLCLNNIIQDNTYMKDYLAYTLMREEGVPSPLCSYVYITVNGEEWGLYLAVEDIEDGFLTRNYGKEYGKLYKPDSIKGGGGGGEPPGDFPDGGNMPPDFPDMQNMPQDNGGNQPPQGVPPEVGQPPQGEQPNGEQTPQGEQSSGEQLPQQDGQPGENAPTSGEKNMRGGRRHEGGGPGNFGGGMGSDDTKLKYINDEPDSYSNIFDNAKTNITEADKTRLIESLRKLSANEDIESVVDTDEFIRYLVVHNFLCNGDSYTGSMVHNYYLYEKDGQLSMLPWDYNLSFGGFSQGGFGGNGSGATDTVNSPIDSPVSGELSDRPMVAWIFADEAYTEQYHQYYAEFLRRAQADGGIADTIVTTAELITPYVERDPTKFCTLEEFQIGIQTLRDFCELRLESIEGQLDGSIPSTSEGQQNSAALVDASGIELSDMGSMNHGGGPGDRQDGNAPGGFGSGQNGGNPAIPDAVGQNGNASTAPDGNAGNTVAAPGGSGQTDGNPSAPGDSGQGDGNPGAPGDSGQGSGNPFEQRESADSTPQNGGILLAVSAAVLLAGLFFAFKFRR